MIAGHKHGKEHKGIKAYGKQKQKRSGKKNLPNDLSPLTTRRQRPLTLGEKNRKSQSHTNDISSGFNRCI
jgi:hypothetical protein